MWGIAKDPDFYRCAIAIAGVASLKREFYDFGNDIHAGKYSDAWKRMTPDFDAVSPINQVDRIKAPLLLPLADHYYTRQEDRVALLSAMEKFLVKYNPAD